MTKPIEIPKPVAEVLYTVLRPTDKDEIARKANMTRPALDKMLFNRRGNKVLYQRALEVAAEVHMNRQAEKLEAKKNLRPVALPVYMTRANY